ncbi:type IV pilus assembly protein PilM [Desulforamulus reducens MI-1]|uniref:Type IV pilus assembly protein PilM n=1 Tax=Desulforamulus reducens (strain ATCC BAA-1160 / DSM 100696 / MI-1) TaxID=349161 RepID=A4J3B1_DESRM|nr:type IV pilus assembly protein PilM [Desulforamulus reducens]ABO49564.1 type IV pilus assembly protein PilM [Desulforamulus reducens MI-1]
MKKFLQKLIKPRACLTAVDIGTHSLKLVKVKDSQRVPIITTCASIPAPPSREGKLAEQETAQAIGRLVEIAGINDKKVITAIAGSKVITRQIKLPFMEDKALADTVEAEAAKYIPLPVEDLIIRYVKLGREGGTDLLNIMLIAAPISLVEQYYYIFLMAGLTIKAIDLQAFGLWRLFSSQNTGTLAVLDIGLTYAQVLIIKEREIKFLRGITIGEQAFQESSLGQDYYLTNLAEESNQPHNNALIQVPNAIKELSLELKRSLDFYSSQVAGGKVDRVILTGGGCRILGVDKYLSNACGIPVQVEVPVFWQGYGDGKSSDFPYDPSYAVPLGLALREVKSQCTK